MSSDVAPAFGLRVLEHRFSLFATSIRETGCQSGDESRALQTLARAADVFFPFLWMNQTAVA